MFRTYKETNKHRLLLYKYKCKITRYTLYLYRRGENQPWRLGKFFADSRFARSEGGTAYVNELKGLSKQPCQVFRISNFNVFETKF